MNNAHEFTKRLQDLLRRERETLAEFLVTLADFDQRRLWVELGYASLFDFLHRELHLSKGAAFYRKTAVGLLRQFPQVVAPLRDGRLCLMTVAEVARVLTAENHEDVLPRFFHLSKRDAKVLAATLLPNPAPPLRDVVTPVRAAAVPALALSIGAAPAVDAAQVPVQPVEPTPRAAAAAPCEQVRHAAPAPPPERAATVEPLTADLNRVHFTVPRRFLEKLDRARAALSHSHPGASMEEILETGLDLLLDRHAKRNGLVKKPRPQPSPSSDPDRIPAHVRRAVWQRDQGRCQWPVASGGACGSTVRVELHHEISRARGGPPTAENLLTLCDVHHGLATRREFGDALIDEITARRRLRVSAQPPA